MEILKHIKLKFLKSSFKNSVRKRRTLVLYDAAGVTGDIEGAGDYQELNLIADQPGIATELPTV